MSLLTPKMVIDILASQHTEREMKELENMYLRGYVKGIPIVSPF